MDNMGDFQKVVYARLQTMPKDFIIDTGLRISAAEHFDPTDKSSILI